MNDTEIYILNVVKKWVWSGYYLPDEVHEMLEDVLEEDVDEGAMRQAIDEEFRRKSKEELGWSVVTDCDRLDAVFLNLDERGICACQNAGYTMSDGYSDVAEAMENRGKENYHGYCFFHGQDIERAIEGHGLFVAFGDLNNEAGKMIDVGITVRLAFEDAGFEVEWDGSADARLKIAQFNWQRRYAKSHPVPRSKLVSPPASEKAWWKFWH